MTRLSVNINKVALIRNARGGNRPDLIQFARDCEEFGAQGITVHPRPDERHIRYSDLSPLKEVVKTEFNIEGYPSKRFMEAVIEVKPHQVTLVPDPPGVLTSSEGWNTIKHREFLTDIINQFKSEGIRVSLFLEAEPDKLDGAKECGTDRIELYTGHYAQEFGTNKMKAVEDHVLVAKKAAEYGLGVNAGHDLDLKNLTYYLSQVPEIAEVSIGHALICDALYFGIQNTIGMYLRKVESAL